MKIRITPALAERFRAEAKRMGLTVTELAARLEKGDQRSRRATSVAVVRAARVAEKKCMVCLRRRASPGRPTCRQCRKAIAEYSARRYAERRYGKVKRCAQCGAPSESYLCEESCAPARRKRRMREGRSRG